MAERSNQHSTRRSRAFAAARIALLLLIGVLLLGVFARLMNYDLSRDEELYVPPAVLLGEFSLYEDFFYNHVPGSAWLYRAFYWLFGSQGLLFSARLAVFTIWVGLAASVAFFGWRLSGSVGASAALLVLVLTNEQLLGIVGSTAANNFPPLPLAFVGLCLFMLGATGRGLLRDAAPTLARNTNPILVFASGIFLAAAVSFKVSAIAFAAPVALAGPFIPTTMPFWRRLTNVLLPLAAGGALAGIPVLLEFLKGPERFFAHVVLYHTGPHAAYWAADPPGEADVALGLADKLLLAHQLWFAGGTLILCLVAAILVALLAASGAGPKIRDAAGQSLLLAANVMALVLVLGFAPTPSFPQYFAPAVILLPLIIALVHGQFAGEVRRMSAVILLVAAVFALGVGLPRIVQHIPKLAAPQTWTVARVHRDGTAIRSALAEAGVTGKVATLLPIYPLEGGLSVYPEFATGQFVYRTAAFTPPGLLRHYRTTSPGAVRSLFENDPPAAMLLGFEPELEAPLVEFAAEMGYQPLETPKINNRYGEGTLWVRKTAASDD
jgi:hypothetical protein